uniref:Uncharacterized protein n=1 Tax=Amphimedon queenslandica TaxID=400682 RepID=A0A1X7VQY2_AMPQE
MDFLQYLLLLMKLQTSMEMYLCYKEEKMACSVYVEIIHTIHKCKGKWPFSMLIGVTLLFIVKIQ